MVLISTSLVALLLSSVSVFKLEPWTEEILLPDGRKLSVRSDHFEREVAFARVAIALSGLLLVWIPFRKGQLWAWCAVALLLFAYLIPIFIIPIMVPFPGWHIFWEGVFEPGLARGAFLNIFFSTLMFLGLILTLPYFLRPR